MTYKIFDTLQDYNDFTLNGTHLTAGTLYLVKENKSLYFLTNNIDGEAEKYEYLDEIPEGYIKPEGNIIITENGEEIDISTYATASVDVPIPEGYIIPSGNKTITQNGEEIDISTYATASVDVPIPEGYIIPTGNKTITQNGENIDVAQYATASVNVPSGTEDLIDLIEGDIVTLNIPNGTTKIGKNAFISCIGLTSVTIPNSVTSIGDSAFNSCSALTSINIPDSVTSIDKKAFISCIGLTSINIPDSVTSIGDSAFEYCSSLYKLTINDLNSWCGVTLSNNYSHPFNPSINYGDLYLNDVKITDLVIPNTVTEIKNYTFQRCSITSVTIPDSVTSIGQSAFNSCSELTSIAIQATTPPTLAGINAFNKTNNCPIYVPAESLEAYKTATNWSSLASRIQAIS